MPNAPHHPELAPKKPGSGSRSNSATRSQSVCREAQPFLKWAGGKSQLLEQFEKFFPSSIKTYCEPFLGGGAVFFHLKAKFPKMQAVLRDNNAELINCYQVVRDDVQELMRQLDQHLEQFRARGEPYYYQVRKSYEGGTPVERAARMIFLNKTCYNGLYRVNGKGQFNVPIGSYRPERVSLYAPANLPAASRALQGADLKVQDSQNSRKRRFCLRRSPLLSLVSHRELYRLYPRGFRARRTKSAGPLGCGSGSTRRASNAIQFRYPHDSRALYRG
jgi:D12 class N6 adenine-specific DNA methyltransferase